MLVLNALAEWKSSSSWGREFHRRSRIGKRTMSKCFNHKVWNAESSRVKGASCLDGECTRKRSNREKKEWAHVDKFIYMHVASQWSCMHGHDILSWIFTDILVYSKHAQSTCVFYVCMYMCVNVCMHALVCTCALAERKESTRVLPHMHTMLSPMKNINTCILYIKITFIWTFSNKTRQKMSKANLALSKTKISVLSFEHTDMRLQNTSVSKIHFQSLSFEHADMRFAKH